MRSAKAQLTLCICAVRSVFAGCICNLVPPLVVTAAPHLVGNAVARLLGNTAVPCLEGNAVPRLV